MFPETRLRRLRNNKQIREMLDISPPYPNKFIWPTFVVPGKNIKEPIKSMPGQYRYSVDMLVNDLGKIVESGIGGVLLFGSTDEENKCRKREKSAKWQASRRKIRIVNL